MINIKTKAEIDLMREASKYNILAHKLIKDNIRAGITTKKINDLVHDFIVSNNCYPSFLNYMDFPFSVCTSVNDEVVHGMPSNKKLKNGDIISVDVGVNYKGYHSDMAKTYIVGDVNKKVRDFVKITEESLAEGIKVIKPGVKLSEISKAIEKYANKHKLGVIRELVGHGIGQNVHEEPDVPNYYTDDPTVLKEGMVLAIEPMLTLGKRYIYLCDDEWTIKTDDGSLAAHFEANVVVTKDGYEILTGE